MSVHPDAAGDPPPAADDYIRNPNADDPSDDPDAEEPAPDLPATSGEPTD